MMRFHEGRELEMTNPSLYVITGSISHSIIGVVEAAIAGGATIVQLREKKKSSSEMIGIGREIHKLTQAASIPLIVNDRLEVALAIGAEGLHIGQQDIPPSEARKIIGWGKILGVSASTAVEARAAQEFADYIGAGPVFPTRSKSDAGDPISLDGLSKIIQSVPLPVVAIGGINHDNAAEVIQLGAAGVAVISAVMGARDPEAAVRQLRAIITKTRQKMSR